ncbi:hypothetical protein KFU94_28000 [Chloroflexi bacterium TSY]|nr:hypothetical protein [Chloroflexi bacterium TSY]
MTPKSLQSRLKIAKNAKFGSTETLVSALLEPINEWEIPIKGIISDRKTSNLLLLKCGRIAPIRLVSSIALKKLGDSLMRLTVQ